MHACLLQATGHCSLREMKQQGLHDHPKHTCCACRLYLLHCWLLLVSFPVSGWPCWSQKYPEIAKIRGFNVDIGRGRWLHTGRVRARWLRVGAGMCVRGAPQQKALNQGAARCMHAGAGTWTTAISTVSCAKSSRRTTTLRWWQRRCTAQARWPRACGRRIQAQQRGWWR